MFVYKNVDVLSVLNQRNTIISGAWDGSIELVAPTNKLWPIADIPRSWPTEKTPFIEFQTANVSSSFNKIIFPSITPYSFLTQSVDSYVYYLDVYNSAQIPIETSASEHVLNTYGIYADTPKLVFENSGSLSGYSTFALIPNKRMFSLAWGTVSQSIGMLNIYAISASYIPDTGLYQQPNAVYNTYKAITRETNNTFLIGNTSCDHVYILHLDKEILKNGIVTGSVEIPLMRNATNANYLAAENIYTSSYITLTDDTTNYQYDINVGGYSNIVSGSINDFIISDIYGKIYYDLGIFILNAEKLNTVLNLQMYTGSTTELDAIFNPAPLIKFEDSLNHYRLFKSLQACSFLNGNASSSDLLITSASNYSPKYFKCKTKDDNVLNPVFLVVKPNEFNYSINPSWIENELKDPGTIESSSIPSNCRSFTNAGEGCSTLNPLEQKYVNWYYPSKQNPTNIYTAYFYKYENGECLCEYLGDLKEYKSKFQLPHLRFKKYLVKREFINNPTTYITTLGLYDDMYRLLAVGKLSKPLRKDNITTYMFKVNIKI
jgi:hypothetical protein